MTKWQFDKKYVDRKVGVHCATKELAEEFLELASSFGYETNALLYNWDNYTRNTVYLLDIGKYTSLDGARCNKYTVVKFESFIKTPKKEFSNDFKRAHERDMYLGGSIQGLGKSWDYCKSHNELELFSKYLYDSVNNDIQRYEITATSKLGKYSVSMKNGEIRGGGLSTGGFFYFKTHNTRNYGWIQVNEQYEIVDHELSGYPAKVVMNRWYKK